MNYAALRTLLRPYPWALPMLVLLGFLASLTEGIGIGLLIPVLQTVLGDEPSKAAGPFVEWMDRYAGALSPDNRLALLALTVFGLVCLKAILTGGHRYLGSWLNGLVAHNLRTRLTKQLLDVNYGYVARQRPGYLIDTLQHQTWRAGDVFSCLADMAVSAATVIVFALLVFLTSWRMVTIIAVGVVVVSVLLGFLSRRARDSGKEAVDLSQLVVDRMVELLDGIRVIRAFEQQDREHDRFVALSERERIAYTHTDLAAAFVSPIAEVLFVPLLFLALWVSWSAGTSTAVLLASVFLVYRMLPKVRQFQASQVHLAGLLGSVEGVVSLLRSSDDKPHLRTGEKRVGPVESSIRFVNVTFDYGPRTDAGEKSDGPALTDVSFEIPKGALVGLVGGSGAGKSTLVNLLCRFYDPVEGQVLVDGQPLCEISTRSWRKQIAIAGQDAELMSGTVAENIAYGRPDASMDDIERAARLADAHGFILAMPEGYQTEIGPRGKSLSAGQRQRVGLARALICEPSVLILDEATNALDNRTAASVERTVSKLRGELTIIVVAHRLSVVRDADSVIVMEAGRIAEHGTPQELLSRKGEFGELCELEHTRGQVEPSSAAAHQ